jgi:hypothetical protein
MGVGGGRNCSCYSYSNSKKSGAVCLTQRTGVTPLSLYDLFGLASNCHIPDQNREYHINILKEPSPEILKDFFKIFMYLKAVRSVTK